MEISKELNKTGNVLINEILDEKIRLIIQRYNSTIHIDHAVTKGTGRESCLIEVLKDIVPTWIGVSTGIAFDRSGKQSPQLDIVLYNKNTMPSFFQEKTGFFPIDSIVYIIEVKSRLTSQELDDTVKKFDIIDSLKNKSGNYINKVLFAYESDLTTQNELERLISKFKHFRDTSNIDVLVSAFKGENFFYKQTNFPNILNLPMLIKDWNGFTSCTKEDAIKIFLMQIMNTLYPIHIGEYIYKNQKVNIFSNIIVTSDGEVISDVLDLKHGTIKPQMKLEMNSGKLFVKYYDYDYPSLE